MNIPDNGGATSSTPQACRREARYSLAKKDLLAEAQHPRYAMQQSRFSPDLGCFSAGESTGLLHQRVTFHEQTRVAFRECRSPSSCSSKMFLMLSPKYSIACSWLSHSATK
jgi:hypothetical protein